MTNYKKILRLQSIGFSQREIAKAIPCSRNTVSKVLNLADKKGISYPLNENTTNADIHKLLYPQDKTATEKKMPDFDYVRKELMKNGVTKKLLWIEYLEECELANESPLMYSRFCYYIQKNEEKRRATMHIKHKPAEDIEVDWAGDKAHLQDPLTGESVPVSLFIGVLSYSGYTYVEALPDEKQESWIKAHIHMYEYFGGASRVLVPDNCKTAVIHNKKFEDPRINIVYNEMAEHYGTVVIPARVRKPQDKPKAEGMVKHVSTWVTAALRNEIFFSLDELNDAIKKKIDELNHRKFQKKEGSRYELFKNEEAPFLLKLPSAPYEIASWKKATVQYNYHISVDGMLYSVPYNHIKLKVDVRITDDIIEIFYHHNRIATHIRLKGRKGQYSTHTEHMPEDHQKYLKWDGDEFRAKAKDIGENTFHVVNGLLLSKKLEQQSYRTCISLLKLAEKYSKKRLEAACGVALKYTETPSCKSVKNILATKKDKEEFQGEEQESKADNNFGITRGSAYYGR